MSIILKDIYNVSNDCNISLGLLAKSLLYYLDLLHKIFFISVPAVRSRPTSWEGLKQNNKKKSQKTQRKLDEKKKTEIERMWWRKTCVDKYPLSLSDLSHLLHRSFDPCPHELAFPVCFRPDLDLLPCVTVDCFFGNFFFSSRKKRSLFVVLNLPQPVFLLTNCDYDNTEGSGMSLYNDHMATSNALRIGSPTGINSPAYRAGQSAPSTLGGVLRPQRSLDAIVDQSTTSSTSNLSHFGSSAIRFRSAQHHAGNDERLVSISLCISTPVEEQVNICALRVWGLCDMPPCVVMQYITRSLSSGEEAQYWSPHPSACGRCDSLSHYSPPRPVFSSRGALPSILSGRIDTCVSWLSLCSLSLYIDID